MTENDYIAEYVKETRPEILGFDFAIWKTARTLKNFVDEFSKAFTKSLEMEEDTK